MKIRIGVLGPKDSVERIMYVANEFPEAEFSPFIYENCSEIDAIIQVNQHQYDHWYLSGVANYSYVMENHLVSEDKVSYPQLHGSSFFGTLLEAQLDRGVICNKFSIDTVKQGEIDKVLSFYELDSLAYIISPLKGYSNISDIVDFHKNHYESGQTEIALTSLRDVYTNLKKLGIPTYRVTPSYLIIKQSLQILMERVQTTHYKNAQMAVIGFKVEFNSRDDDDLYYSFKLKHKELELRQALLYLTEKVNGSLVQMGDGLFFLFTTRGELETQTEKELFRIIEDMKVQANIQLVVSIGYGETVLQAEKHVRYGFRNHHNQELSVTIVDDDFSISIKEPSDHTVSFTPFQLDKKWMEKIPNVSPAVVSKIAAYAKRYGRTEFTSQDVASWIQSSDRNGRRIIKEMEKAGVIKQCGEMQPEVRGRPRRVFQFSYQDE